MAEKGYRRVLDDDSMVNSSCGILNRSKIDPPDIVNWLSASVSQGNPLIK